PLASSLRTRFRGDPPHDGPSAATHVRTAYTLWCRRVTLRPLSQSFDARGPGGVPDRAAGEAPSSGGSPRKRVRSELASGATSGGGGPQAPPIRTRSIS